MSRSLITAKAWALDHCFRHTRLSSTTATNDFLILHRVSLMNAIHSCVHFATRYQFVWPPCTDRRVQLTCFDTLDLFGPTFLWSVWVMNWISASCLHPPSLKSRFTQINWSTMSVLNISNSTKVTFMTHNCCVAYSLPYVLRAVQCDVNVVFFYPHRCCLHWRWKVICILRLNLFMKCSGGRDDRTVAFLGPP